MVFLVSSLGRWLSQPAIALAGALLVLPVLASTPAQAAERVIFTYGPLQESLTVTELEAFANDGDISPGIAFFLGASKQDAQLVRKLLTQDVRLGLRFLDKVLNSLPGEYVLFQAGKRIHTPVREDNLQALRAAFVLSASGDNKVSILELLKNYPTREMYVDGQQVVKDVGRISRLVGRVGDRIEPYIAIVDDFLEGLICNCEAQPTSSSPPEMEAPALDPDQER